LKLRGALRPLGKTLRSQLLSNVSPTLSDEIARDDTTQLEIDPIVAAIRETLPRADADELLESLGFTDTVGEISGQVTAFELWLAFRLLRAFYRDEVFDTSREHGKPYREAAAELVRSGFRTVIFGHTHHAVRETIDVGTHQGIYVNTGTWADLVRVPESIGDVLQDNEARRTALDDTRSELAMFLAAMRGDGLDEYILRKPTFARIQIDPSGQTITDLCEFVPGADPASREPLHD
ncbi:MAG: hypothetical protein MI756_16195, partial [Chromatiales bacterium]|nr:hypothetical protein [Chromatiales bacterium]